MSKLILILFMFIYIKSTICLSQNQWTLDKCISYAMDNNIKIKREELKTKIQNTEFQQSKLEILPSISAGATHFYSFRNSLNQNNYQYESNIQQGNENIQGSLTLFKGFQTWNTILRNKYSHLASIAELENSKLDVVLDITSAYLQVLFCNEALDIAKSQLNVSTQQVEKLRKFNKVGNATEGSILEIQAQFARDNLSVTNAQSKHQLAVLDLVQLLDLDSVRGFEVVIPNDFDIIFRAEVLAKTDYKDFDFMQMPQIKNAEYLLKSTEYGLRVAKGTLYPSITIAGTISSRYQVNAMKSDKTNYSISDQLTDKLGQDISISILIPIFSKGKNYKNLSIAKIQVQDNIFYLEQEKKDVCKEIQKSISEANAAYEKYKSNIQVVSASEEAFKYAQHKFSIELISYLDYSIVKNNLLKAKSDLLQAKYEFFFKIKMLDFFEKTVNN